MIYRFVISFLFFSNLYAIGQTDHYQEYVDKAKLLAQQGDYRNAGNYFSKAFWSIGNKGALTDRMEAARVWAKANMPDSAFTQLFKIAQSGHYRDDESLSRDSALHGLRTDPRWPEVMRIVKRAREDYESKLNDPLMNVLNDIYDQDQDGRKRFHALQEKYGHDHDSVKHQWAIIHVKDSLNQLRVIQILNDYGWLGPETVGEKGSRALFLVIQHADLEIQLRYLPLLREATKQGKANAYDLALLEDRISIRQGKHQIYGSQVYLDSISGKYFVLPLIDPDHVNERRHAVGLGPIEEYTRMWGFEWDLTNYKRILPELEARYLNRFKEPD